MNYLLFVDDDEYPLAVYEHNDDIFWQRQDILGTHLNYLDQADITHGHHCGYISPIPVFDVNDSETKDGMNNFLRAVSNDIVSVEAVAGRQERGGVDYASIETASASSYPVEEKKGLKFISGSNLGLNLKTFYQNKPLPPFYNPEGARGEDTFLSACLSDYKVLKVPCYAFHDGFLKYDEILQGVLPIQLQAVKPNNSVIIKRFYKACLGWIRYKPLLLYITDRENFETNVEKVRSDLENSVQVMSRELQYNFFPLIDEFNGYVSKVTTHYQDFQHCQEIWNTISRYAASAKLPRNKLVRNQESCELSS
ncbi:hypothetical protein [Desulfitobacterium sp.]|uniref:hypothetical protein n=1 Tax=Desulfitobacterium sp. TaxID=49981 RepID=UPI002B55CD38|nr:hypothetical protein [Desulfitobacterium sp.]HVJ49709.1 hypothetical protein [Desulfitobacterium sp.]